MKKVHYISGLPRSCSTLLCNLLAQNPNFHSSASSALIDLMYPARKNLAEESSFHAMQPDEAETMFLDWARGGISHAYDSLTDRPVVFDKGRSWIGYLDLLYQMFPDAKVLVTVRDIRGIITSMETLRRKHPAYWASEEHPPTQFTTIERRAQAWLASPKLGLAIERLNEAVRLHGDKLYFVHAENLTKDPIGELEKIHEYLGEPFDPSVYDPKNVQQYTHEHDGVWWPQGNHTIKPQIKPLVPKWREVLGRELSEQIRAKFEWVNEL